MIKKRDGKEVEFDKNKIVSAIYKASLEAMDNGNVDIANRIADEIENSVCKDKNVSLTVAEIQDMVESLLMKEDSAIAKRYIIYRHEKDKFRSNKKKYKYLSDEFISKYKHMPEPFRFDIGKVTYYRTYSRPVPEENRRENWWETIARVVDFNADLEVLAMKKQGIPITMSDNSRIRKTAEDMYELMFNMKLFPSGRSLWVGGTPMSYDNQIANFNCSFVTIDAVKKFSEMLLVLMLGTGVGLSVEQKYVKKMPKFNTKINVVHKDYTNWSASMKKEHTELSNFGSNGLKLTIGDSRFGWSKAMEMYFEIMTSKQYKNVDTLLIDYNHIRPYGTRIKTFGGQASGHEAMKTMFTKITKIFTDRSAEDNVQWQTIRSIDALDISTCIAEGVVAGGTRRSALIVFCDPTDTATLEAKQGLYTVDEDGKWSIDKNIAHRSLSNNTVFYEERPTKEQLDNQFKLIRFAGEPSFGNMAEMKRRRPDAEGGNPCFEIILRDRGTCNLSEVNMFGFVNPDGSVDYDGLFYAQRLSGIIGYRMASVELELNEWDIVNREDRLTGCSLTGVMDFRNASGINDEEFASLLKKLRAIAQESAYELADKLKMNRPKLVTAIKPSGTISLLPTVSSGVHFSHSPYYIRRIRISAADPLAKALVASGFNWNPENGETIESHKTKVFEFPVSAPEGKTKYDVSAIEQLELYKLIMENYIDHNASNTIHVRDDEWELVSEWVYDNWNSVVGITFLSLSDSFYQLMPLEAITKERYEEMMKATPKFKSDTIRQFENFGEEFDLMDDTCDTGLCPVR